MDLKQMEVLMRSFPCLLAGIFGLIFNIFIWYDNVSIIFSVVFLILGVLTFMLGVVGKTQRDNYGSAGFIIACIVITAATGIFHFVLAYFFVFSLVTGVFLCGLSGYCVGLYLIVKRLEKGESPKKQVPIS